MIIPLLKVDAVRRLVYARIDETPDRAGEIFDYASSKPHFQKWSSDQEAASNGLSKGNLRAMHGRIAAGVITALDCDDQAKAIEIVAHVTDDAEWNKVTTGTYTGISPGGGYGKRWPDGRLTRYTAKPNEISLVDLPCIPSATFTMIKGDGLEETVAFTSTISEEELAKAGRRHSQRDLDNLQAIHDHAVTMGACCEGDAAEKAALTGDLAKVTGNADRLADDLAKSHDLVKTLRADLAQAQARIADLEKMVPAGNAHLRAVSKGDDVADPTVAEDRSVEALAKLNGMEPGFNKALGVMRHTLMTQTRR